MIEALAEEFGESPDAVLGKSRVGRLPDVRHWWWWTLVRDQGMSRLAVSRLADVHESSVRHALRKCDRKARRGEIPASLRQP